MRARGEYPFASTPHWVRYVDPATGAESRVVGIPVNQNGSWLEGWEGEATVDVVNLRSFEGLVPQRQFFVIAHDGDNSGGRAGSESTWYKGRGVTCTNGVQCMGISEYLAAHTPPASDVVHGPPSTTRRRPSSSGSTPTPTTGSPPPPWTIKSPTRATSSTRGCTRSR